MTGLPARVHPLVRSFLADQAGPAGLLARWGSPLNVLFPEIFTANVAGFRDELDAAGLRYRICYAHKANQGRAFVRAARAAGIGIDVASPGELDSARSAGFPPGLIEATGPKGRDFLGVLAGSGITVNADNLWELGELARLGRAAGCRVPALVRMCGLGPEGPGRPSRFGVPAARFGAITDLLAAATDAVDFLGLSFHLDSSEASDRARAVDECLRLLERAWSAGLSPRILDIGGGFRQAFADSPEPFQEYGHAVRRGLAGQGPPLTWGGATLGFRFEEAGIRGALTSGKYASTAGGRDMLRDLAARPLPGQGGRTVARVLRDNMLELWLEPGKALVDHAGLTLASVEFTKEASDGSVLVNLDISRDKICPAGQEVMLDPVLLYRSRGAPPGSRTGVFFAGNLCLERDMVFSHLTFIDRVPEPGNIVAFINTAAYQMDLSASGALMQREPAKAVVRAGPGGGFTAHADQEEAHQEAGACSTSTSPS